MLAERRIIFISQNLDISSCCAQMANLLLYPMTWEHIFVPVLPFELKESLSAPVPYLIGMSKMAFNESMRSVIIHIFMLINILTHNFFQINKNELDDVVIYDCDRREFESNTSDKRIIPVDLLSKMRRKMLLAQYGSAIPETFLNFFIEILGSYRDGITFSENVGFAWKLESFLRNKPQQYLKFFKSLTKTQMFNQFISNRLDILTSRQGINDDFEILKNNRMK